MNELDIFSGALELAEPIARARFLNEACGQDPVLRKRIEALLHNAAQASRFMHSPPHDVARTTDQPVPEKPGTQIGPYKLLQQIGEGGMGVVYMAEQTKPVERRVALKIIKPGMDTKQVIARFEAERQALAMMDHPNIARVLDAGTTEESSRHTPCAVEVDGTRSVPTTLLTSGRPFFVMELVKGVTITDYCDAHHLTPKERLELFLPVLNAVQHAHQKGIIHRDIKPSNVLVAEYDNQAVPKVIDFGVAKATNQRLTDKTMFTQYGQLIGTLEYMSPEQAKLNQMDIDTRSDIYSLGVLLYELLTGDTPFDRKRLRSAAFDEMMRIIREEEPPMPSTRLTTSAMLASVSANRSTEPRKLSTLVRGELDWIVMKAMEKERSRRYETPNAFADDIQRFLKQEAITARPASAAYRFKKFTQRNRSVVIAGSLIAATLILGFGISTWQAIRANQERYAADQARIEAILAKERAEKAEAEGANQLTISKQREAEAKTAREAESAERAIAEQERDKATELSHELTREKQELSRQKEEQRRMRYSSDMNRVQMSWESNQVKRVLELLNAHRPGPGQVDLRGFEWHYWNRLCNSDLRTVKLPVENISGLRFSVDGTRMAGATELPLSSLVGFFKGLPTNRVFKVWNAQTGEDLASLPLNVLGSALDQLVFHPDGKHLAVSHVDPDGNLFIKMWDIDSGTSPFSIQSLPFNSFIPPPLWFSKDGTRMAMVVKQEERDVPERLVLKFWNARTGVEENTIPIGTDQISGFTLSPDGLRLAFQNGSVGTKEGTTGIPIHILEIAGSENHATSLQQSVTIPIAGQAKFLFGPDGKRLYVSEYQQALDNVNEMRGGAVFDVESGRKLFSLPDVGSWTGVGGVTTARFSPDGEWLAAYSSFDSPNLVKLFSTAGDRSPVVLRGHNARLNSLAFSSNSQYLFTVAEDGHIKTWEVASATRTEPALVTPNPYLQKSETSYNRRYIATAPRKLRLSPKSTRFPNVVTLRNESGTPLFQTAELIGPTQWLKFSSDGSRVAVCHGTQVTVWDSPSGVERLALRLPNYSAAPIAAISPDGSRLAMGVKSDPSSPTGVSIKTWDVGIGRETWESEKFSKSFREVKFSPNGRRIVGTSLDTLAVWDAETGRLLWRSRDKDPITSVDFSADSMQLFGFSKETGKIQFWDADSGQERQTISHQSSDVLGTSYYLTEKIVLSSDGRKLAFANLTNASPVVTVWDLERPDRELFKLTGHKWEVDSIAFSPDNRRIATSTGGEGAVLEKERDVKLWDAETGQELLTLQGNAYNIAFDSSGTTLIGMIGESRGIGPDNRTPVVLRNTHVQRWDASRLSPQIEAEQIVEALVKTRGVESLPLASEMLANIELDKSLPDDTRTAAVALVNRLRRETILIAAATAITTLPDQSKDRYERALQYLIEAGATNSDTPASWKARGLAHYRLGQFTDALAALKRSQELYAANKHPKSTEDLVILSMVLHQIGKSQEAQTTLEQARTASSARGAISQKLLAEAESLLSVPKAADNSQQ